MRAIVLTLTTLCIFATMTQKTFAACCTGCPAPDCEFAKEIIKTLGHENGREDIFDIDDEAFKYTDENGKDSLEDWMLNVFFMEEVLPALKEAAQQDAASTENQNKISAQENDAKVEKAAHRKKTKVAIDAANEYKTSKDPLYGILATVMRPVPATLENGKIRATMAYNMALDMALEASKKQPQYSEEFYETYATKYCDPSGFMGEQCVNSNPKTMGIVTNNCAIDASDENGLLAGAMAMAIFMVDDATPLSDAVLNTAEGRQENKKRFKYLTLKTLAAKTCAENIALHTSGDAAIGDLGSRPYLVILLKNMGISDDQIDAMLPTQYPSVQATLDVLTLYLSDPNTLVKTASKNQNQNKRDVIALKQLQGLARYLESQSVKRQTTLSAGIVSLDASKLARRTVPSGSKN